MIFSGDTKKTLGIILGAGFLFRLQFLGSRQLWTDELLQGLIVRASSPSELAARLRGSQVLPAPLDYFIQKGIILLLGDSAWTLRLHAAIFGALSLWLFFRIAVLLFGNRVAVYATILFTVCPLPYHFSQEARPFALFLFLALLSYDFLLTNISTEERGVSGWILLSLLLTLTLYSSFLGFVVLLTQWAALIVSAAWEPISYAARVGNTEVDTEMTDLPRARWSHVVLYGMVVAAAVVLFAPWVRYVWGSLINLKTARVSTPQLILRSIKELGDGSYPMTAVLLLGAAVGVMALRRHARPRPFIWLVTWIVVPIPILFGAEFFFGSFWGVRHTLLVVPPLVLLAGYGFSYVGEQLTILDRQPHRISSPAIFYACLVTLISVWVAQSHWRKEPVDWKGAAQFLEQNSGSGAAITMPEIHPFLEYYVPTLADFRAGDMDPGPGSLQTGNATRRCVVCLNPVERGPCAAFQKIASGNAAWRKVAFRGLTIFVREK